MRASSGLGMMAIAAALAAAPALGQSTSPPPASQETVGPRELRDFSLPGTTPPQQQPQQPSAEQPGTTDDAQPSAPAPQRQPTQRAPAPAPQRESAPPPTEAPVEQRAPVLQSQPIPEIAPDPLPDEPFASQPVPEPVVLPPAASAPVEGDNWNMLPWLLAALLGAAAAAYFLGRRRSRAALANAEALDAFVPAEPAAAARAPAQPKSEPAPPPVPPTSAASSGGIVSTGLRPRLELECLPQRCIIDDRQAVIEFAIVVQNGGNGPARDVRVEVAMINAGPAQDQEIQRFFEQPAGIGESLEIIPPMRSLQLNSRVSLPLDQLRPLEMGGRRLFVPLLAFNALYRSAAGPCQTSRSYLVGREGEGEKLAPFRLDLGPRIFRSLGTRPHHMEVRR